MKLYRHPSHPHLTKIVATISGEDADPSFIRDLYQRGMDVVRLNSAHMKLEEFRVMVKIVREISPSLAVMIDTKGPNIRTCNVEENGRKLTKDMIVRISGVPGNDDRICVNYAPFVDEVPVGSTIVCDDGAVKFTVTGKEDGCLLAKALFDSVVENRKSVNVPDVSLKAPALSEKDREFLREAAALQCDFVAHSFVRNAEDVREVKRALGDKGSKIGIIAKIENREGVQNIQEILNEADGIMVARGDLGIEIPLEEVPVIQKKLIQEARKVGKPVITATQMLQSMTKNPAPTRAEVSDVANAVYDGTDAVMLSGETAHGHYPRESVEMMRKIVLEAENAPSEFLTRIDPELQTLDRAEFILAAAVTAGNFLPVKAIICSTLTGRSARHCSSYRPKLCIYAPTPDEMALRQLALSYGVFPALVPFDTEPRPQALQAISSIIGSNNGLQDQDLVILFGKIAPGIEHNNLLCVATVRELKEK